MKPKTLIIAEAGVNHNGDMALARSLIDAAADAGADLVKFQTFQADRLVTAQAAKAQYQVGAANPQETQHAMLRKLELSEPMHKELIAHCKDRDIGFFSTGFDIASLDLLKGLGQTLFKVPSGEITNLPYLKHIGQWRLPVILSTGMARLGEIEDALEVLVKAGTPLDQVTVLHCTTQYPTPMADVNLRAMTAIGSAFGVAYGYSDHTQGIEVATAAVALGASVIEKHFTISRDLPGPDHQASLEPAELAAMVKAIRNIEIALGDGVKKPSQGEVGNISAARKSLVARTRISKGTRFSPDNVDIKRPGTGLSPMLWDQVIGQTASRDFEPDDLIAL